MFYCIMSVNFRRVLVSAEKPLVKVRLPRPGAQLPGKALAWFTKRRGGDCA